MEWGFILLIALAIPVLMWIAFIWASVASGLYRVALDALRRRVFARNRKAARAAKGGALAELPETS